MRCDGIRHGVPVGSHHEGLRASRVFQRRLPLVVVALVDCALERDACLLQRPDMGRRIHQEFAVLRQGE